MFPTHLTVPVEGILVKMGEDSIKLHTNSLFEVIDYAAQVLWVVETAHSQLRDSYDRVPQEKWFPAGL